jgi:hypothetical protein
MNSSPDYTKYSLSDLYDSLAHIDNEKYPDRYKLINEEIEKRKDEKERKEEEKVQPQVSIKGEDIIRIIGGYELINGVIGIIFLLIGLIVSLTQFEGKFSFSPITPLIMYTLLCFAGIQLLKTKKIGFILSIVILFIQTILIKISGFVLYFSSLIKIMVLYNRSQNWSNFDLNFGVGFSSSGILFNLPDKTFVFGINILCIVFIALLLSQKNKFK